MTNLLFVFWLVTAPTPDVVCTLWVSNAPTVEDISQACGTIDLTPDILRLVDMGSGEVACERSAADVFRVAQLCARWDLGIYQIQILTPPSRKLVCSVTAQTSQPTDAEILAVCGQSILDRYHSGELTLQAAGQVKAATDAATCRPPVLVIGAGMLEQPARAEDLATSIDYRLLAGRLLWFGVARADCDGWSGVDPVNGSATDCGMRSARLETIHWQNTYDADILAAARAYNVPARILKALIAAETQFWPLWTGQNGERGLTQITDDAADLVMLYVRPGYAMLSIDGRFYARAAWRNPLACELCTLNQAVVHARRTMPRLAEALSAYWCAFGSWDAALRGWNIKHEFGGTNAIAIH
jgi:hypothetical protein